MHAKDSNSSGIHSALLSVAAIALAGTVGMIGLLREVGDLRPKVGDIISFDPLAQFSRDMKAQLAAIPATDAPTVACMLDVRAMHAGGGSIVIEQRQPESPRAYRIHWAGGRTSNDGTDCGGSVDLLLDQEDLAVLAVDAGGYGVAAKKFAASSFWHSSDPVTQ